MPELSLNDWVAYVLLAALFLIFIISFFIARARQKQGKAQAEARTRLDAILHSSSERGEGILVGLSEGDGARLGSLAGLAGLQTQAHVFKHSLISDVPPKALAGDGTLVTLSQQLNAGIYEDAVMPELFRMDNSGLAGIGAYAYMAGLMPELGRPKLRALVMQGEMSPELILALDLADRHHVQSVVASSALSGQAVAFLATKDLAIGEEAFLSQASNPRQRAATEATLLTLKIIRTVVIAGLFGAVLLYFFGVLP